MDGLEMLYTRRSVRAFSNKPVAEDTLQKIVKAGLLAATARNLQPVHIVIVKDVLLKKKLAGLTDYGKFIARSPVCLVVLSEDTKYYLEDGSACTQNILLAARYFGIGTCWVAGDKKGYAPDIVALLDMPASYKLICLIAVGFPRDDNAFREKKVKGGVDKIF
jgi:nitroreductase